MYNIPWLFWYFDHISYDNYAFINTWLYGFYVVFVKTTKKPQTFLHFLSHSLSKLQGLRAKTIPAEQSWSRHRWESIDQLWSCDPNFCGFVGNWRNASFCLRDQEKVIRRILYEVPASNWRPQQRSAANAQQVLPAARLANDGVGVPSRVGRRIWKFYWRLQWIEFCVFVSWHFHHFGLAGAGYAMFRWKQKRGPSRIAMGLQGHDAFYSIIHSQQHLRTEISVGLGAKGFPRFVTCYIAVVSKTFGKDFLMSHTDATHSPRNQGLALRLIHHSFHLGRVDTGFEAPWPPKNSASQPGSYQHYHHSL